MILSASRSGSSSWGSAWSGVIWTIRRLAASRSVSATAGSLASRSSRRYALGVPGSSPLRRALMPIAHPAARRACTRARPSLPPRRARSACCLSPRIVVTSRWPGTRGMLTHDRANTPGVCRLSLRLQLATCSCPEDSLADRFPCRKSRTPRLCSDRGDRPEDPGCDRWVGPCPDFRSHCRARHRRKASS